MRPFAGSDARKSITLENLATRESERALFVARGDVFTRPHRKPGPTRNLTNTSKANERYAPVVPGRFIKSVHLRLPTRGRSLHHQP